MLRERFPGVRQVFPRPNPDPPPSFMIPGEVPRSAAFMIPEMIVLRRRS
ncbi:hypothetical protein GCM10020220_087250 [Nonomuraea rubra]